MKISGKILENLTQNINSDKSTESKSDGGLFNSIFANKNFGINTGAETNNTYQNLKSATKDKKAPRTTNNVSSDDDSRVTTEKPKEKEKLEKNEKTSESSKTDNNQKLEDISDDAKKDAVYNELASFLGITVDELKLKMDQMGISEDSLTSLEGIRSAIMQLTGLTDPAELLNLDGIKDLFAKIDDILTMPTEEVISNLLEAEGLTSVDELLEKYQKSTEVNTEVTDNVTEEVETENQDVNRLQSKPSQVSSEVVNSEEPVVEVPESTEATTQVATQEVVAEEAAIVNEVAEEVNLEGNKVLEVMEEINQEAINTESVQAVQSQSGSLMGDGQAGGNSQNADSNSNTSTNNVMNNIMFTQDAKGQATTFNTIINNRMTQNVNQQDIINQLVEKMKVNINGDTSEVRITLRPEHLGDVTLKIATQNGIVKAEFLAENETVKALIEANFQDLQDTLRQKGLEVSDFTTGLLSEQNQGGNARSNKDREARKNNTVDSFDEEEENMLEEIKISNIDLSV